ncbi:MAG TPA: DUF748 domain-containing protein [Gammaproteobacteria bacterium]|nr:DUF748 domain-containing protein [Gammaproteobacteria bacterium]
MRKGLRVAIIAVAVLVVIGVAARLAAPTLVERYVNRSLADMGEYRGTVSGVDLHLLAGGYVLRDLQIVKIDSAQETPFAAMPTMDLTLQWHALFRGQAVGEVVMHDPVLNFVQGPSNEEQQLGTGVNWPQEIRDLFPFRLNVVEAHNGLVTFRAPGISTNDSLTIRGFEMRLRNLTNVQDVEEPAFAEIDVRGGIMGNAPVTLTGRIDPNEMAPTFDIDMSIEGARLVDVNPWLREFLKVDAEDGVFSMYSELAAFESKFEGYVRPILENPKFTDANEDEKGPLRKAWEGLVNVAAKILENKQEQQVATQIPLRGNFEDPDVEVLTTIVNLLRNAFVAAFSHSLEGSINLRDVASDVRRFGDEAEPPQDAQSDHAQSDHGQSRRERREERRQHREEDEQ